MAAKGSKDNQRQLLVTGNGDQVDDHLYAWYRQTTTSTSKNTENRDTII